MSYKIIKIKKLTKDEINLVLRSIDIKTDLYLVYNSNNDLLITNNLKSCKSDDSIYDKLLNEEKLNIINWCNNNFTKK